MERFRDTEHSSTWYTQTLLTIALMRKLKGKYAVIPVNAIKACKKSRGTPPLVIKLRANWRWVVNIMPRPLIPPTRTLVSTKWRLGGPQSRGGRFGEDKSLAPIVIRTPDRPACSLVSAPTTLSWLANERTYKTTHTFNMFTEKLKVTSQSAHGIT